MKIATWNVNSLNVRLPHVLQWLAENPVDALCLQETKLVNEKFPVDALAAAGYRSVYSGQKTYNGVAILARGDSPFEDVTVNLPTFPDEHQRALAATIGGMRLVCLYVPNGQSIESDKYAYKLAWLEGLKRWVAEEMARFPRLALLGDFNIAPADEDVHDPAAWEGQVLCSDPERSLFKGLLDLGLADAYRLFPQAPKTFSWWDYRNLAFRRNMGLRIDHILLSGALREQCTACTIDRVPRKWEQPSDHAPVVATLSGDTASEIASRR